MWMGTNLICGLHGWDYRVDTGVSEYNNEEALTRFPSRIDTATDQVLVDADAVAAWAEEHPHRTTRDSSPWGSNQDDAWHPGGAPTTNLTS